MKILCVYKPHFLTYLLVDEHVGLYHSLAIVNIAAINVGIQVCFGYCFHCFGVPALGSGLLVGYVTALNLRRHAWWLSLGVVGDPMARSIRSRAE